MNTNGVRAAIYLRVSRDDQTTENQRLVLARVAEHRGWLIVQTYEDQGISGAKGRDQRPAFDAMLKDAVRRRYDILMVWSIDRLGRSVLHVANALAELDAAGIRLYCDQQGIDILDAHGPRHDPDGVGVWRAGKIDAPQQSPRRPGSCPPAGEEARPPEGVTQGRERHQDASERREGHTEGGGAGRRRERHGAAGEEGDGGDSWRRRRDRRGDRWEGQWS